MAGAVMSIVEKIDTERHRRDIKLCRPVSQPDATGFSVAEAGAIEPNPSTFSSDYCGEHTIGGKSLIPVGFIGTRTLAVSKSAQAETATGSTVRAAHPARPI
jgi:hypothetical protein